MRCAGKGVAMRNSTVQRRLAVSIRDSRINDAPAVAISALTAARYRDQLGKAFADVHGLAMLPPVNSTRM